MIHVARYPRAFGIDPARLGVAGDSAGGGLAAAVCRMARDAGGPASPFQLLICPILDVLGEAAVAPRIGARAISWTAKPCCATWSFIAAGADLADPRLSPLLADDLPGLPPAFIHTGQFDPFGDEGEAYAAKLMRAGVHGAWPRPSRHDPLFLLHAAHDPLRA